LGPGSSSSKLARGKEKSWREERKRRREVDDDDDVEGTGRESFYSSS
jgi:hypothetical protein